MGARWALETPGFLISNWGVVYLLRVAERGGELKLLKKKNLYIIIVYNTPLTSPQACAIYPGPCVARWEIRKLGGTRWQLWRTSGAFKSCHAQHEIEQQSSVELKTQK